MNRILAATAALCLLATPGFGQVSVYPSPLPAGVTRTFNAKTVNLAVTGDQGSMAIPSTISKYVITGVRITNCSTTPVLAQPTIYTGASASGTNIVAAAVITGATSASVVIASTLAGTVATTTITAATLFVNVNVANVGALTCDFYVTLVDLS